MRLGTLDAQTLTAISEGRLACSCARLGLGAWQWLRGEVGMFLRLPWLGCLSLGMPLTTLFVTALLFYAWERQDNQDPPFTTISEGGQSGWSYVAFSLGTTLSAVIFLMTGCFFLRSLSKNGQKMTGATGVDAGSQG